MEPRGGMMVGMNRDVRGGRVITHEYLLLAVDAGDLVYTAHPSGQQPAAFTATRIADGRVRFENPDHDFPQMIEYLRTASDSLLARVYGSTEDTDPAFVVPYGVCESK